MKETEKSTDAKGDVLAYRTEQLSKAKEEKKAKIHFKKSNRKDHLEDLNQESNNMK